MKRKEGFFDFDQRPEIFRNSGRELVEFQIFSSYSKQKVFNDMFISCFSSLLFILHLSDTGTLVLLCRSTGNFFKNGDLSTDFSKKKFLKMFLEHLHYKLKIPASVSSLEMVEIKMEHIVENLLFKIRRKKFDI